MNDQSEVAFVSCVVLETDREGKKNKNIEAGLEKSDAVCESISNGEMHVDDR